MKKALFLILAAIMCLSIVSCRGNNAADATSSGDAVSSEDVTSGEDVLVEDYTESPKVEEIPSVDSASVLKEGSCGNTSTFKLYDNGVLVVSGEDYITESFEKFNDYIEYIKVEEGITYIGNQVFSRLDSCKVVELPSTLKTIATAAFAKSYIETINLPDGLETIGENAFYMTSLTSVEIPGSIVDFDKGAFSYCDLEELIIRDGVAIIPKDAFRDNNDLKLVVIPGSVKYIEEDAFSSCDNLETVILCEGVESIGAGAFENIKTFAIPDSVGAIAYSELGEANPTNGSSTVYCNDGSYAADRFSSVVDVIVGYDGFIKNYNLDDYT